MWYENSLDHITYKYFVLQRQIFTSILINILALGTGAGYGIANVLYCKLEEHDLGNSSSEGNPKNIIQHGDRFDFTITMEESSWIGAI